MNNLGALLYAYGIKDDAERMLRRGHRGPAEVSGWHTTICRNVLGAQGRFDEAVEHALPRHRVHADAAAVSVDDPGLRLSAQQRSQGRDRRRPEMARVETRRPGGRASSQGDRRPRDAERATDAFIEGLFDRFSSSFDSKLARLEYRAPELVGKVLDEFAGAKVRALRVLDIGCGTGLCAVHARDFAAHLTGIDLSAGMLPSRRAAPASTTGSSRPS